MTRVLKDTNTGLTATEIQCIELSDIMMLESFTFNSILLSEKYFTYFSLYMQRCIVL